MDDPRTRLKTMAATLLPALKEVRRRREPAGSCYAVPVRSADSVNIDCRLVAGDPRKVVVVAHPAVVGSRYVQVTALADELANSFSVMLFDFRGHGHSGGKCKLGFSGPALDLAAVIARARALGFEKVGVAGFSMGAGAAFICASEGIPIDSFVSIGCPPSFPDMELWKRHPRAARAAMRLLGLRLDPRLDEGPAPIEVVNTLGDFPKLLVWGKYEVAAPEDIERFKGEVPGPKETLTVEGAWHADLQGNEALVREWFERTL